MPLFKPKPQTLILHLGILIVAGGMGGCSQKQRVTTNTVLAHTNCKGMSASIKRVTLSDVAAFRGSTLITPGVPGLDPEKGSAQASTPGVRPIPESAGGVQANSENDLPLFIALSKGVQPTRGYELHLADQAEVTAPGYLQSPLYWTEPDATKSHPWVNTHPCLVVSIPNENWQHIEAIDQHGQSVGTLRQPQLRRQQASETARSQP